MRTEGTKYDKEDILPAGALPVSTYAKRNNISSAAYVHVKYDRFRFGYTTDKGIFKKGPAPKYRIIDYEGINYVVEA